MTDHATGRRARLNVGLVGLGHRVEGEVVGVLDAAGARDLDAQRQAGRVVLGLAQLEDASDRLRGDGEHRRISRRGGVSHAPRLTSGSVTDTTATTEASAEPNEGHGPEVLYEVADHVATITLNRPHRRNAISGRIAGLAFQGSNVEYEVDVGGALLRVLGRTHADLVLGTPVWIAIDMRRVAVFCGTGESSAADDISRV